jgi:Domain of unknown function (DUF5671)
MLVAMARELTEFVARALERGVARAEIESTLLAAGWPKDDVSSALAGYADVDFPVPVPRPRPYLSAREAFLYLVLFLTLYTFAISWGRLLFELVNAAFPDPSVDLPWRPTAASARWAIASLVVSFPAYLWLARRTYLAVRRHPAERTSRVRKWLTYLTLFVTAAVLLCDLITLVYQVLGGELSVRFVLKVAIVAAVAGSVFGYYLWLVRQDDIDPDELPTRHGGVRIAAGVVVLAVLVSLIAGMLFIGSPRRARAAALDERRVQDLRSIHSAVALFWTGHQRLPSDLDEIAASGGLYLASTADPVTAEPYEYRVVGGRNFELCAVFDDASPARERAAAGLPLWSHTAGRVCFELLARE